MTDIRGHVSWLDYAGVLESVCINVCPSYSFYTSLSSSADCHFFQFSLNPVLERTCTRHLASLTRDSSLSVVYRGYRQRHIASVIVLVAVYIPNTRGMFREHGPAA